jgi:hypothetical protein
MQIVIEKTNGTKFAGINPNCILYKQMKDVILDVGSLIKFPASDIKLIHYQHYNPNNTYDLELMEMFNALIEANPNIAMCEVEPNAQE